MADVRAEEESLVQRLKLNEGDKGENEIQKKLDKVFKKSRTGEVVVAVGGGDMHSLYSFHSLLVTNARITLKESLRDSIKKGLQRRQQMGRSDGTVDIYPRTCHQDWES